MARHELWVELVDQPGSLAAVATALAACGANIVHIDVHPRPGGTVVDRLVVDVPDHRGDELRAAIERCGAQHTPPALGGGDARATPASPPVDARQVVAPLRRPPTVLERLVALADGGLVRLRDRRPGDDRAIRAHQQRCSAPARHDRRIVDLELTPDWRRHVDLVAVMGEDIVGVGGYDAAATGADADVTVTVEDRHQGRGIGTLLVAELALLAQAADLRRLRVFAAPGDPRPAATLRRAGLEPVARRRSGVVVLECSPAPRVEGDGGGGQVPASASTATGAGGR